MADENVIGEVASVPPQAGEKVQRSVTHACEAAENLHSGAGAMAAEHRGQAEAVLDEKL